jgi:hypothetical protein
VATALQDMALSQLLLWSDLIKGLNLRSTSEDYLYSLFKVSISVRGSCASTKFEGYYGEIGGIRTPTPFVIGVVFGLVLGVFSVFGGVFGVVSGLFWCWLATVLLPACLSGWGLFCHWRVG